MQELRKPSSCPKCNGEDVRRIVGGRPTPEAWEMVERGEAVLGTCFIERDWNDWRCMDCNNEWHDPTDPARIEVQNLLDGILEKLGRLDARENTKA